MDEWIYSSGKACYNTDVPGFTLSQTGLMEIGKLYVLNFSISNMTKGKLTVPTITNGLNYTTNGDYQIIGLATYEDLIFLPGSFSGVFDGCLDVVELREIPFYSIVDSEDNVVFTLEDETGVTSSRGYVQYNIDWSDLEEGCYYLKFTHETIEYRSDCFTVKLTWNCTKQVTWNCNEDAFGFNYSDLLFTQTLRIEANLWKSRWKASEKEVFDYSNGDVEIVYVAKEKEQIFTTEQLPEYIHDALSLALDSDNFFIDGLKYVFPDEEVTPSWRNSSNLAPLEVTLRRSQNYKNVNCG